MSEVPSVPRPSRLFRQMSPERRRLAAEGFWRKESGAGEHAEVIALIAQRLKFRTKSVAALPIAKKTQYLLDLLALPEMVAARLLVAYHMAHQRPLMAAFLDALGVQNTDGLIDENTMVTPDADKLRAAAQSIAASFSPEDVALYLSTLYWQDPETWALLPELPETAMPVRP